MSNNLVDASASACGRPWLHRASFICPRHCLCLAFLQRVGPGAVLAMIDSVRPSVRPPSVLTKVSNPTCQRLSTAEVSNSAGHVGFIRIT